MVGGGILSTPTPSEWGAQDDTFFISSLSPFGCSLPEVFAPPTLHHAAFRPPVHYFILYAPPNFCAVCVWLSSVSGFAIFFLRALGLQGHASAFTACRGPNVFKVLRCRLAVRFFFSTFRRPPKIALAVC